MTDSTVADVIFPTPRTVNLKRVGGHRLKPYQPHELAFPGLNFIDDFTRGPETIDTGGNPGVDGDLNEHRA